MVSHSMHYLVEDEKQTEIDDDNERNALSLLDKCHSFLFHSQVCSHVASPLSAVSIEEDTKEMAPASEEAVAVQGKPLVTGTNGNKFVTSTGSLVQVLDTAKLSEKAYYRYAFGNNMVYHDLTPRFLCLKDELMGNDIDVITDRAWSDTLQKSLYFLKTHTVQRNYRANEQRDGSKYGIRAGEVIGVDSVLAILFYCNYDQLQNKFSLTFRKVLDEDTDADIVRRHCHNFYWLGRCEQALWASVVTMFWCTCTGLCLSRYTFTGSGWRARTLCGTACRRE